MSYYKLTDEQRDFIFATLNFWKGDDDTRPPQDRGDDDIRQALIEPLAVTTLIQGTRALEDEMADRANGGEDPRPPDGDDYNELFALVRQAFPESDPKGPDAGRGCATGKNPTNPDAPTLYSNIVYLTIEDDSDGMIQKLLDGDTTEEQMIDHLLQWDYGEGSLIDAPSCDPPWGTQDWIYRQKDLILSWNPHLGYASLTRVEDADE